MYLELHYIESYRKGINNHSLFHKRARLLSNILTLLKYLVPLLLAILLEYVYRGSGSAFSSGGVNEALSVRKVCLLKKREPSRFLRGYLRNFQTWSRKSSGTNPRLPSRHIHHYVCHRKESFEHFTRRRDNGAFCR